MVNKLISKLLGNRKNVLPLQSNRKSVSSNYKSILVDCDALKIVFKYTIFKIVFLFYK